MKSTTRLTEWYDLRNCAGMSEDYPINNLPDYIHDTQTTNPFRGFYSFNDFATANPNNIAPITGQHKSPQALTNVEVLENGDILCYPPNVSVPYWSKIIFKNYDYLLSGEWLAMNDIIDTEHSQYPIFNIGEYTIDGNITTSTYPIPKYTHKSTDGSLVELWDKNNSTTANIFAGYGLDLTDIKGLLSPSDILPLYLKMSEYQTQSKVIFGKINKFNIAEVAFKFGYQKGQREPVRLNLSLGANVPVLSSDGSLKYNYNLTRAQINSAIHSCSWSIEWISEPESGN